MQKQTVLVRAHTLVEQFEQANREVIETVEQCTEAQWQAICASEGWSVAATAHHIAWAHEPIIAWVVSVASGNGMPPITMDEIDALNREHAEIYARCDKAAVLELLRTNGAAAAAAVRTLSDEALDESTPIELLGGQVLSAEQLITLILIGHPGRHLASIRAAIGML
jgi:uncharacterized damage-inducible protein DinB